VSWKRRISHRALDVWFPTLARYFGLGLMAYAVFFDQGQNPALVPAATGLIFLKTVLGNGNGK